MRKGVLEPSFRSDEAFASGLAKSLAEFAKFNGCNEIRVEKTEPRLFKKVLESALSK